MLVLLEVFGKFPNTLRQDRDLDFGRAGVFFVLAKLFDRVRLCLSVQSDLFRACAVREWLTDDDRRMLRPSNAFFSGCVLLTRLAQVTSIQLEGCNMDRNLRVARRSRPYCGIWTGGKDDEKFLIVGSEVKRASMGIV